MTNDQWKRPRIVGNSDNETGGVDGGITFTQRGNNAITTSFRRSQFNEEDLVLAMIDNLAQHVAATRQVRRRELAFEDGVLQVISHIPHGFEGFAETFVIADVITDQIGVTHGSSSEGCPQVPLL